MEALSPPHLASANVAAWPLAGANEIDTATGGTV